MSAHCRQSEQQNIIDRTHTWQQYSVTILGDISTTKYGFNLRKISPLCINNELNKNTGRRLACRACANPSAQSPSWHTFEATHATLSGMKSKGSVGKQSFKRYECQLLRKVNTGWRNPGMTADDVCLMFTWALKIAPGFPIHVGK